MQSIIELAVRISNLEARISELGKQESLIDNSTYQSRMHNLTKEHDLVVKMLLNKVAGIYFKDSTFTIDNFDLVKKDN